MPGPDRVEDRDRTGPETPAADMPYYVTDSARVTQATGWRPERSLAATLADVHEWLRG